MKKSKILIVTTSHDMLGSSGLKTGVWFEEIAAPYYIFRNAGLDIDIASTKGGKIPIDPASESSEWQTEDTLRFTKDKEAMSLLKESMALRNVIGTSDDYNFIYFPGGHGPMWDFVNNPLITNLLEEFIAKDKPVGAMCHGVAVLVDAQSKDGESFTKGKKITAFSNSEEVAVGAQDIVPFLLETKLKELGSNYSKSENFAPYTVVDGNLVTGQNPASAAGVALEMMKLMN
ncbi:type 1 glutamine amidotransferase domain-containing protein [Flagellimonas lutimaris]|uniref:Type 1 glutamine amidotransferase domain-containing protein n=1 Tax=Flagellimonas lutimaris TaxID=475082 RepID=A0A3A1N780_9FLAO|nr:type 1 glutamine amidotransferase domain-containing protein [Allomuricauda lutimaris]RIV31653.1 type 1 glutamine amidotransferase domain-containing protein [Allomuricauda lutimaris]